MVNGVMSLRKHDRDWSFFEKYIIQITQDTPFWYQKKKINKNYLIRSNEELIVKEIFSEEY